MTDGLHEIIREFTGALLNPRDLADLLDRLTRHTLHLLDASGCGIMLEDEEGHLAFAAASNDDVVAVELHQERIHEGACFDAYRNNELVRIDDVSSSGEHWPGYRQRVLAAGMWAVLGVPMNAFGRTIGVMNVYRATPGAWTPDDVEAAEILTAIAAIYIIHAHDLQEHHELTTQLQDAIGSRDVIGQAKGILMAREQVDAEGAFEMLRTVSQRSNRKLREVAQLVIDDQIDLPTEP